MGRAGSVSVRAFFWEPFPDARPEVIVSRDGDDADGRAALRLWERMARDPQSPEQLHFVDGQLSPSRWGEIEDVQRFLEAVSMELSAPVIASEWVRLSGDSTPGDDHDFEWLCSNPHATVALQS